MNAREKMEKRKKPRLGLGECNKKQIQYTDVGVIVLLSARRSLPANKKLRNTKQFQKIYKSRYRCCCSVLKEMIKYFDVVKFENNPLPSGECSLPPSLSSPRSRFLIESKI